MDESMKVRAQGCLLGQLAGDALGSMVEFRAGDDIQRSYPGGLREMGPSPVWGTLPGQPTDDSELALALARTLAGTGFDPEEIAVAYARWFDSAPFDVGGTTTTALSPAARALQRGESAAQAAQSSASGTSEANGALMRQSPLAIWGARLDPATLDEYVRLDTRITHPNRVCQDASAAFVVALAATIREGLDAEGAYRRAYEWDQAHGQSEKVTRALVAARENAPAFQPSQGHVIIALQNAFYQALHAPSVEEGIVATVMGGGDTDTNAAIAGALLGAIGGLGAFPTQWREAVLNCRPAQGTPGVRRPRPEIYWPVDALDLAETLLEKGPR